MKLTMRGVWLRAPLNRGPGTWEYAIARTLNTFWTMITRSSAASARQPLAMLANPLLLLIIAAALAVRLYLALTTSHIWDEDRDWMVMAERISFDPNQPYLPIRSFNHGALPAYFIKLGALIFGENAFGFRAFGLLAGTATIAVVALIAHAWAGRAAALWAAALIAFNEFHAMISIIGIQGVYCIFFGALAAYFFVRALKDDRPSWLIGAAACTAISILCYEIMYLMIPVFAVTIVFSRHRTWFTSPFLYAAGAIGFLLLLPDLSWNLTQSGSGEMSYASHLDRLGGVGFTQHYLLFFFRDAALPLYAAMGRSIHDGFGEYAVMNILLGLLLFAAALFWTWRFATRRESRSDTVLLFMLAAFWLILGVFSFLQPGESTRLDNRGWLWVQFILVPAVVFAGALISQSRNILRFGLMAVAAIGAAYGVWHSVTWRVGMPAYTMALIPQSDTGADMISYHAALHSCAACDPDPNLELVAITARPFTGAIAPPFSSDDVAGAEIGTPDRSFIMRRVEHRGYTVVYRLTTRSGASYEVSASTWPGLLAYPPPYWWQAEDAH